MRNEVLLDGFSSILANVVAGCGSAHGLDRLFQAKKSLGSVARVGETLASREVAKEIAGEAARGFQYHFKSIT